MNESSPAQNIPSERKDGSLSHTGQASIKGSVESHLQKYWWKKLTGQLTMQCFLDQHSVDQRSYWSKLHQKLVTLFRSVQTWTPALLLDDVGVFYMKFNWTAKCGFVTETNWNIEMQRIHLHHRCHGASCFTHLDSLLRQNFAVLKACKCFRNNNQKEPKSSREYCRVTQTERRTRKAQIKKENVSRRKFENNVWKIMHFRIKLNPLNCLAAYIYIYAGCYSSKTAPYRWKMAPS